MRGYLEQYIYTLCVPEVFSALILLLFPCECNAAAEFEVLHKLQLKRMKVR
jgi:hypothetical protein